MAKIPMAPTATPTPIPAFAPSERPLEDEDEGELVLVAVGTPVVAEAACLPNWAGMLIALSELQHVVLSRPQHHVSEVGVPSQGVIWTVLSYPFSHISHLQKPLVQRRDLIP